MTFEERKTLINKFIKQAKESKSEDSDILSSLYDVVNLEDNFLDNPQKKDRLKTTNYSNLSKEELYAQFSKSIFNKLDDEEMEHLFQETYNRQAKEKNCEPRYIVNVENNDERTSQSTLAYVKIFANLMHINKQIIQDAIKNNCKIDKYNSENIAPEYLMCVLHETQHTIQNEKVMQFFTDENKTKEEKGFNAVMLMYLALHKSHCREVVEKLMFSYNLDSGEHDANMGAINTIKDGYESGMLKGKVYEEVLNDFSMYALRLKDYDLVNGKVPKKYLKERLLSMEKQINEFKDIYDMELCDGEFKTKILNSLNDYMKVDEKGNSTFRTQTMKDFVTCANLIESYNKNNTETKQEEQELTI